MDKAGRAKHPRFDRGGRVKLGSRRWQASSTLAVKSRCQRYVHVFQAMEHTGK